MVSGFSGIPSFFTSFRISKMSDFSIFIDYNRSNKKKRENWDFSYYRFRNAILENFPVSQDLTVNTYSRDFTLRFVLFGKRIWKEVNNFFSSKGKFITIQNDNSKTFFMNF